MKPKALVIALATLGAALPNLAQAAEPVAMPTANEVAQQWADLFVYAVTPYCQVMSNGMRVCQPMGMVGPAPTAEKPSGQPTMMVPLAPPTPPMSPAMANQYLVNPYMRSPYVPQPGGMPPAMMGQPSMPQFAMPQFAMPQYAMPQFMPPQYAMPQYAMPQYAMPQFLPPQFVPPQGMQAATYAPPVAAQSSPSPSPTAIPTPPAAIGIDQLQPAVSEAPAVDTASTAPAAAAEASGDVVVHFEFDSAELDSSGRLVLDIWLARAPKGKIHITGHADRLGPEPYNVILSRQRAENVKKYLTGKGLKGEDLKIFAMGEKAPIAECKGKATPATKACLAPNRRVEIKPQ